MSFVKKKAKRLSRIGSVASSQITEDDEMTRTKITRKLKENAKEVIVNTTAHGIKPIVTKRWFFKIIWALCLLTSLSLCFYTVVSCFQQYFSYGVNTLVEVVPKAEIIFPVVSICNLNPLASPTAYSYIRDYYATSYNISLTNYSQF